LSTHQCFVHPVCSFLKWLIGASPKHVVWFVTGGALAPVWANLAETETHGMQVPLILYFTVLPAVSALTVLKCLVWCQAVQVHRRA
jgi:hypothetical protein